ncbi:hypothetical protein PG989_008044 [Apiospora arundinis]
MKDDLHERRGAMNASVHIAGKWLVFEFLFYFFFLFVVKRIGRKGTGRLVVRQRENSNLQPRKPHGASTWKACQPLHDNGSWWGHSVMTHRPDPAIARSVALPLKLQNPESTRPSQIRTMLLIIQITCVVRLFVVPATDEHAMVKSWGMRARQTEIQQFALLQLALFGKGSRKVGGHRDNPKPKGILTEYLGPVVSLL